jgi:hypothetical protein
MLRRYPQDHKQIRGWVLDAEKVLGVTVTDATDTTEENTAVTGETEWHRLIFGLCCTVTGVTMRKLSFLHA